MRNASGASSGGIGFAGLLTVAFVVLKLTGHIDWPWLWVLSPLWITACLWVVVLIFCIVIIGIAQSRREKRRRERLLRQ